MRGMLKRLRNAAVERHDGWDTGFVVREHSPQDVAAPACEGDDDLDGSNDVHDTVVAVLSMALRLD